MNAKATPEYLDMVAQRDAAYRERNRLVAALTRLYPSHLALHGDDPTWDPEWLNIVCVHAPCGQLTWHIHDSELSMFQHLLFEPVDWDGHTTEEKYKRLDKLRIEVVGVFREDGR